MTQPFDTRPAGPPGLADTFNTDPRLSDEQKSQMHGNAESFEQHGGSPDDWLARHRDAFNAASQGGKFDFNAYKSHPAWQAPPDQPYTPGLPAAPGLQPERGGPVDTSGITPDAAGTVPTPDPAAAGSGAGGQGSARSGGGGQDPLSKARAEERAAEERTAQAMRTTGVLREDAKRVEGELHGDEGVRQMGAAQQFRNNLDDMNARMDKAITDADDVIRKVGAIQFDANRVFKRPGAALMAMGAMISDKGGKILDSALERDFKEQVEDANNQRQMAREKMNLVQTMRLSFNDRQIGDLAAMEAMNKGAQEQLKGIIASTQSPVLRAEAEEKARELEEKNASLRAARIQRQIEMAAAAERARQEKEAQRAHELSLELLREGSAERRATIAADAASGRANVRLNQQQNNAIVKAGIPQTLGAADDLDQTINASPADFPAFKAKMIQILDPKTDKGKAEAIRQLMTPQERQIMQSMAHMENMIFKARSGAAVTEGEASRLVSELRGAGSIAEVRRAINMTRRELGRAGNTLLGYDHYKLPNLDGNSSQAPAAPLYKTGDGSGTSADSPAQPEPGKPATFKAD